MRKLLKFDFSAAVDGTVNDGAVEIETAKMKCQMSELLSAKWLLPPDYSLPSWSSSIRSFEVYDLLTRKSLPRWVSMNWFTLSHWRAISLSSRIGEQTHIGVGELVYPLALESRPIWVSGNWFTLSHRRAISLSSRTGEQTHIGVGELVYPLALESN